ncbi:FeoA family protein [Calycomorphotria hydatis]|uniref:FeoA domain protein n=1 Tax=Calycomorphotria hydatis TaxID=2528027 RepID=A0A517T505_9PLAN|nr:FeoA family protein [Calycomorphotria hydatis]QDT63457.1 FeoA domain protein [Calycomorphotria hydatis]
MISPATIPLEFLQIGETACVRDICGEDREVHRLAEMGLAPGTRVSVVKSGSPLLLAVNGQRLCFRADASTTVLVEPLG